MIKIKIIKKINNNLKTKKLLLMNILKHFKIKLIQHQALKKFKKKLKTQIRI